MLPFSMSEVGAKYLKERYRYNQITGDLADHKGNNALRRSGDNQVVRLRGGKYVFYAARVIWAICTGDYPERQVGFKNGNKSDLRLCNLQLV